MHWMHGLLCRKSQSDFNQPFHQLLHFDGRVTRPLAPLLIILIPHDHQNEGASGRFDFKEIVRIDKHARMQKIFPGGPNFRIKDYTIHQKS